MVLCNLFPLAADARDADDLIFPFNLEANNNTSTVLPNEFLISCKLLAEMAQGELSVTGEHSPYNNMGKMGKKLAKRPIYRIFSFKRPNFDQKNLYFSTHIIYMTKGEFPWGKVP